MTDRAKKAKSSSSPSPSSPSSPPPGIASSRDRERIRTVIALDHDSLAVLLADRIVEIVRRETAARGRCVLGLATGSTPVGIYRELIRRHRGGEVDFSSVVTFNLDEYYPMPPDSPHSYHRFMRENFFDEVGLPPARTHLPDGAVPRDRLTAACEAYERAVREAGGIDFQLLGIGKSGHIGFNEPGSGLDSRTRLVTLDTLTRKDAAADFFGEANVPREAVTMGVATILEAREIALIATGEHKSEIVRRAVEGEMTPEVAATYLQRHPNAAVYLDPAAAAELTRVGTPWVLEDVAWTPSMTERAVVWLAERTGKAILKLTARDYIDHQLSALLSRHGEPGPINGLVFNRLGARIRGRSKLPRGRRVLVFSPHPDDDVISMGGLMRKLVLNDNAITVAYLTSGNIAVFDHDVRRHLDFVERAAGVLAADPARVRQARESMERALETKQTGEMDTAEVLTLKRLIRESEAVAALDSVGLGAGAARFLNLPFYQTGQVRKLPIGEDDVRIVARLLEDVRPDLVFVAGDLSDPHGTHRLCRQAVAQALARTPSVKPEVWLYRGAWQEWSLTEADVLVPLAQDELRAKILAIFKHQSQKDVPPFPGGHDDREFWQRVEARNLETAAHANRLGLAEYYAMEAYVIERV